jgi:hypothetical protein
VEKQGRGLRDWGWDSKAGVGLYCAEHLMNGCEECTYQKAEELAVMVESDVQQRDDKENRHNTISCFSDR